MRYRTSVLRVPLRARPLLLLAPALLLGWGCSSTPAPKVEFFVPGTPIAAAEFPGADRMLHGFGHYHEEYRCTDGRWQIRRSRITRLNVMTDANA